MAVTSTAMVAIKGSLCGGSLSQADCETSAENFVNRLTQGLAEAQGEEVINRNSRPLYEAMRYCFRVGDEYKNTGSFDSGRCITGILDSPETRKAGDTNIVTYNKGPRRGQRETRTLLGAGSRVPNPFEGVTITQGVTTFWDLLQAGRNAVVPPAPPVPVPTPAPQSIASQVVIAPGGDREKTPFITKPESPQPLPLEQGKVAIKYYAAGEGLRGSLSAAVGKNLHKDNKREINLKGSLVYEHSPDVPSNPRFIHSPTAEPGQPQGSLTVALEVKESLNGSLDDGFPTADFIEDNYSARHLEAMCVAKWGEQVAGIYLDSVLRKRMAATLAANLETEWNNVVTVGALKYQTFLTGAVLPEAGEAQEWADLFKYDPAGFIEMIALWAGKSYKELKDSLSAQATALESSNDTNRLANFGAFITAVRGLNITKNFQLPQVPPGSQSIPNPHEEAFPSMMALEVDATKLAAKEEEFAKARNKSKEELQLKATALNIPYPFDIANATNPWMAQANFEKFVAKLKKGDDKKATWFLIFDAGLQEYGMAYSGLGLMPGILYAPDENSSISGKLYVGYPESGIASGSPNQSGVKLFDGSFNAMALAVGGRWNVLQRRKDWLKTLGIRADAAYAFNGAPQRLLSAGLGLEAPIALSENWTVTPSVSGAGSRGVGFGFRSYQLKPGINLARKLSEQTSVFVDLSYAWVNKHTDISANDAPSADGTSTGLNDSATGMDPNTYRGYDPTIGLGRRVARLALGLEKGRLTAGLFLQRDKNLSFLATPEDSGRQELGNRLLAGGFLTIVTN